MTSHPYTLADLDRVAAACAVDARRRGDRSFPGDLYKIVSVLAADLAATRRQIDDLEARIDARRHDDLIDQRERDERTNR